MYQLIAREPVVEMAHLKVSRTRMSHSFNLVQVTAPCVRYLSLSIGCFSVHGRSFEMRTAGCSGLGRAEWHTLYSVAAGGMARMGEDSCRFASTVQNAGQGREVRRGVRVGPRDISPPERCGGRRGRVAGLVRMDGP